MSLTNKLQSILSTKRQIKDAINSKGGNITNETPFNEYPNQVLSLPSGGGEGDNGKFKEIFTKSIREITKEDLEGVTSIPEYALYKCTNLNSISIPNSVTEIDYAAFGDCSSLISIEIPDTLAKISTSAFFNCSALTSIFIPISVNTINANCFNDCTKLTIYCEAESKPAGWNDRWNPDNLPVVWGHSRPIDITYIEGAVTYSLRSLDNSAVVLSADPSATEVIIPEFIEYNSTQYNVSAIPANLLQENTVIETLEIPFIGLNAETPGKLVYLWEGSDNSAVPTSLKNVSITAATIIKDYAFSGCSSLTSVVIGDSVTSIGYRAFSGCSSLTEIVIGDSVTSIGGWAFSGCSSLNKINFTGTIDQWVQIEFGDDVANPTKHTKNLYINNELVTEVDLTTATSIGSHAFYDWDILTSVTIPNSVTSIGIFAFAHCDNLTSVVIPDSVTSIGMEAFAYCDSLTSIKYRGTQEQWNAITKGKDWDAGTGNYTITYNYTGS